MFVLLLEYIKEVLKLDNEILSLAKTLYKEKSLIVMGRGFNFATCLEGALVSPPPLTNSSIILVFQKIKELTYLHSEGILSGELKHGPLAMIDTEMPVIMIIMKDNTYTVSCCVQYVMMLQCVVVQKCINALEQVSARAVSYLYCVLVCVYHQIIVGTTHYNL